jgi:hypothetical protein
MCGIVAKYSAREPIPTDALERATRRLAHRGPDGQRTGLSHDRRVGLGHARLSIIDLATGDKQIASEDGAVQIAVNGEFYDFERSQRDLEGRGHRLRTRSDSEIALHLYEDYGTACLRHLSCRRPSTLGRSTGSWRRPPPGRPASGSTSWCRKPCAAPSWPPCPSTTGGKVVALLDDLPALGDAARTALDPGLTVLLSACCLHRRYFQ